VIAESAAAAQPATAQAAPADASPPPAERSDAAAPASPPAPTTPSPAASPLRRFAFLAIPAVALLELGAHLVQTHTVVAPSEWLAARDVARTLAKPEDLVLMSPYWTDPVGRELFKDELLSVAREARPDASRFPRAVELSIRGQHDGELASWRVESARKVGPVTVTVYDNPLYVPLKDDLVDHIRPGGVAVSVVSASGSADCGLTRARVDTGPLGFGPAIPADRVACPTGGLVAATVMQPGDYRPHRCLFAPPLGAGKTLRVRFLGVPFGTLLHGHAGLDWDSTAHTEEPPVTLVWKLGDRTIGRVTAGNDDGWKSFALDTRDVAGQTGEIVAEISAPSSRNRLYCFEADTR